ncbi:MAG TPA: hypothetical protein VN493_11295 [Thermoanaerobaculia bacterium]|nr:hypothetical protein [Thermoanaerobaculia bacterium]
MNDELVPIAWRPRAVPLEAVGVAARGEAARAMARRLLARSDEELARLSGVAGQDLVILLGDSALLPWVEGAAYLGRDIRAPSLLLPTNREPTVPLPLVERALVARASRLKAEPPLAVLLDPPLLASAQEARPLVRRRLRFLLQERG